MIHTCTSEVCKLFICLFVCLFYLWSRGVQVCEGIWLSCQVQLEEGEGDRDGGISQYSSEVRQDVCVCVCLCACVVNGAGM